MSPAFKCLECLELFDTPRSHDDGIRLYSLCPCCGSPSFDLAVDPDEDHWVDISELEEA